MPEEFQAGCQRPPIKKPVVANEEKEQNTINEEAKISMIKVGKPAPDFTASAYSKGKFFNVSLSEFKGKWVLLCFYPGDFTFV